MHRGDPRMTGTDEPPRGSQSPGPGEGGGDSRAHLDRSLTHGVAWMGSVRWATQLVTWASTLIVVRLLSPDDYALVGLATIYLGVVTMLSEFGIGATIVTLRHLTPSQHAQINTLAVAFGVASLAVSVAAAPILAWYFESPRLTAVIVAMSTIFVITGIRTVPQAVLQRDMRFRDLALNDGLQAIALAVGSVVFAWLGLRYWTLVLAAVVGALLSTIGVLWLVRVPFERPRWETMAGAVAFSRDTIVARLAWYLYANSDFFVAQKMLGENAMGAYRVAWDLTSAPLEKITSLVGRVTPSVLSAAQHDAAALRRYLLRITETLALVTFPATIGMALVARDLVPLVLGERWVGMIAPLQLLGIAATLRGINPILPQVLVVTGGNRLMMLLNLLGLLVMPVAFIFGSRWGTAGVAAGWITAYPVLVVAPMMYLTFRQVDLRITEYLRALAPAVSGVLLMCLAVVATRQLHPASMPRVMSLAADIATGAAAYPAALLLLYRDRMLALVSRVRGTLT